MNATQTLAVLAIFSRLFAPIPTDPVSHWCEDNIVFNEPNCQGPFSLAGREYLREPLNTWSDSNVTDAVLVFGARCGKTRVIMGGIGWMIENEPARVLWVMPNTHGTGGAQNVSRTRWQPMLRSSAVLADLIPSGARRHEFKSLQQIIGGSLIDFAGSNSPANLASNPARVVVLDEVDKFNAGGKKEADAAKLADERAKEFSNPKRFKTSTPTTYEGLIWQELLKTDLRRRFVPCPHCAKHVVFAWSATYTVLPKTGCEAYVKWDQDARTTDGKWDLEKVRASAHAECPHCKGKILDQHKTKMDRAGEWRPTQKAANGYRGWHLPSMYSASKQTSFGALAVKFLQAKNSLQGLQGFINGDLAEPYQSQDRQSERVELVTNRIEVTAEWKKLLTGDCQYKAPHYWCVVRAWNGGNSKGIWAGSLDTADEIRSLQLAHGVPDLGVMLDSGYGARSEAEVYRTCARFCQLDSSGQQPKMIGWMPAKGMPTRKRWKNKNGVILPYFIQSIDPFLGTSEAGQATIDLFEFAADYFKDILENLRKGKGGYTWEVVEAMATDEYWRHMDGQLRAPTYNKRTGRVTTEWVKRSRHWPDHLFACEYAQVALASFYEFFSLE
jgi:hypothetical protein